MANTAWSKKNDVSQTSTPSKHGDKEPKASKAPGAGAPSLPPNYDPARDELKMRIRQAEFEMARLMMLSTLEKERAQLDALLAEKARRFWAAHVSI